MRVKHLSLRVHYISPVLVSISQQCWLFLLLLFAPLPARPTPLPPESDTTPEPLQDASLSPPQGRFAFSVPIPVLVGAGFSLEGRVGLVFPLLTLYANYSGGIFGFNHQVLPLYGIGVSLETQTFRVAARALQTPLHVLLPYLVTESSFHGGEALLGLRLGSGALDFAAIFRMGVARTLNYLDSDRLLLQATIVGDALIERGIFLELRAVISFDWIRDMKSQRSKFALRGFLPLRLDLTPDSMLRWYLYPYFGYIRSINTPAEGILTDFLYAPNRLIRGDSTAGVATELRLYPLQPTMVPVLEDLFLAALGSVSVYHLSPKRLTQLEEHYRFGGAVGLRLFKAVLAGVQIDYSPFDQWKINLYLKGEA